MNRNLLSEREIGSKASAEFRQMLRESNERIDKILEESARRDAERYAQHAKRMAEINTELQKSREDRRAFQQAVHEKLGGPPPPPTA